MALIVDAALQEVSPCRAMDVIVFLDSKYLSVVGRPMQAVGQDANPVPSPRSWKSDGLSPHLAQYAK